MDRPKSIHKRARTSSTELLDEEDEDPTIITHQQGPPLNWHEVIVNHNSILKDQMDQLSKRSPSFSSTEGTAIPEDEMSSVQSLIEQAEGFESGFETFDDFLNFSPSDLEEQDDQPIGEVTATKSKSKLKRKFKKLKTKLKTSFNVKKQLKRVQKNSGGILRLLSNATALLFRGVLFLTVNVLIVLTVIISLAIV